MNRKYFWAWLNTALLVVVLSLLTSCAGVVRYEAIPVLFADSLEVMGKTICDPVANKPIVFVQRELDGTKGLPAVVFHEMVHSKQALEYPGGCNALLRDYRSNRRLAFTVEAEAYCETLLVYGHPNDREENIAELKTGLYVHTTLSHWEKGALSRAEADAIIDEKCRVERPIPIVNPP